SRLPGLPLVRQADRAAGGLRHPAALPRAHRGARGSAGGGPQPNCAFSRSAPRQPEIPHGAEAAAYRIARPGDGENHYPDHQPLSPRRHDFGRRVPRTLANRGVLPGAEAEPAAQVVCGHQPKRGSDPDLDSTDRHPVAQVFTAAFPVPVVAFQPGGAAASTTVCLPRPLDVDRRSVPAATRVAARTSATELTVHLSRAASQLGQPNANLIQKSPKMASKWRAINTARGKVCLIWTALGLPRPLRLRNLEIGTDLAGQEVVHFAVPWNRRRLTDRAIDAHGMIVAFSKKLAAKSFQVANQIDALHAAGSTKVSRMTAAPSKDCSDMARFAPRTSATASRRLLLASSRVLPWVLAPGSSSTNAT